MVRGQKKVDTEVAGLLYREKFGLSYKQLLDEPADQVGLWLALENERAKEEKRQQDKHKRAH